VTNKGEPCDEQKVATLRGKGTFSCMSFTFAPPVGVQYFRAFFGRERCVLCFCALKNIFSGHPLNCCDLVSTYLGTIVTYNIYNTE
jgi:hypothetical protein